MCFDSFECIHLSGHETKAFGTVMFKESAKNEPMALIDHLILIERLCVYLLSYKMHFWSKNELNSMILNDFFLKKIIYDIVEGR